MNANSLVINQDKSRILIISPNINTKTNISIKTPNREKPIKPVSSIVYLGIHIQDNLRWNQFIKDGPNNLIKRLKQKLNAVKMIKRYINFKTTKSLLNGVFMSYIYYGATLWGGAPKYLIKAVQRTQLEA